MKLNLELLRGLVTEYGTLLYTATPQTEAGSVSAGEYVIDGNSIAVTTDEGVMYFPIRTARIEQGIDDTQSFNIGIFVAQRDASGEYNGKTWSVSKGDEKAFAY